MRYQTVNPFTERLVKTFPEQTDEQLQSIIDQAQDTFSNDWSKRSPTDRKKVLKNVGKLVRERREELAQCITLEMGKLITESRGEVDLSADILEYYADNADAFLAPEKLKVSGGEAIVENAPLGVLFCIEPWNFPYYQLARVAGPNLMIGNTLIAKHAPNVPQCALAFEKLFIDGGAPKGTYTNVFLSNEQAAVVIADPRIRGVALTGSEHAGSAVAAEAGKALKKSTMELGGTDAYIVLDDADMDKAVKWGVVGRMNNAGQACCAAKRFILEEPIADEFVNRFKAALAKFIPGDPADPKTTLAPLCTEGALTKVESQIDSALKGGATVLLGGKRVDRQGYFLEPTILSNVRPENPVFHQEFFAPVAMIFRVKNDDEAIKLANDSPYGLGGSIITNDVERGKRMARQIDTGMVFVNQACWTAPDLPFGGVKNSGYGRELSDLGIGEFVNKKLIRVV
ncbi:MAG: NAD-dependent succinate-semialdehyde dehydrogenase [Acidobacteriota bacterium]|nr:NAD-dependent succinate-semialdehyde dehydrogenase [Acidobacteriota bacterium]